MSDYTNIDLFRIYAGTTFAFLYESFPMSKQLNAGELVEHCNLANDQTSRSAHELIVRETWRWLHETDYLRHDADTDTYNLTPRSFEGLTFLDNAADNVCRGCPFRPHPAGDSDLIRPSIPFRSGQGFRSIRPSLWRAAGQCRW